MEKIRYDCVCVRATVQRENECPVCEADLRERVIPVTRVFVPTCGACEQRGCVDLCVRETPVRLTLYYPRFYPS